MKNVANVTLSLSALTLLSLSASLAPGAITSVSGNTTWLGSPPASCGPGMLTNWNAYTWNEKQNVSLSAFPVDMVNNPGSSNAPISGAVSGVFDSHFIHYESIPGVINATGTVTFSAAIVGVIFQPLSLDNSDIPLGALATIYPTGYPLRGLTSSVPSFFSINGNTLSFNLNSFTPSNDIGQIRVLTDSVPTPGVTTTLAAAGLTAMRRRRRA